MANLKKRLEELETQIKNAGEMPVWIDGKNSTVRVDVNRRRGEPVTFHSPIEAIAWIEKQIGAHAGGVIAYHVDNICDLHENGGELREVIRGLIPGQVVIPQAGGQVIGGQVKPLTFDADNLPVTIGMGRIDAGAPADMRLWCLAGFMDRVFGTRAFEDHWKSGDLTGDENQLFLACLAIYSWQYKGEKQAAENDFARLFFQVTGLEPAPGLWHV